MAQERILIVEDDPLLAIPLGKTLISYGFLIAGVASSGESAILMAEIQRPSLILMDINLKGPMDGIDAAQNILASSDVPIIYMSVFSDDGLLNRAKKTLPYGYLIKPINDRELFATISMALSRYARDKAIRDSERYYREFFRDTFRPVLPEEGYIRINQKVDPYVSADRIAS